MDDVPLRDHLAHGHAPLRHRYGVRMGLARSLRRARSDRVRLGLRGRPVDGVPDGCVSGDGAGGHGGGVGDQQHDRVDLHVYSVRLAGGVRGQGHVYRDCGARFRVCHVDGADDGVGEELSAVDVGTIQGVCQDSG